MNKKCARCDKTVYPIEELKCLDKIWHKQCFKCQECGMTLNMRTYKGFDKQPYCEAHIPKAKATTVAETPEYKRIAENTKIQSNVKYHEDFEKAKGKVTQIADDPEILRIRANTKIISNVAYHGDLEKKAIMELKREKEENGDARENHVHHPPQHTSMPMQPPATNNHHQAPANNHHHQPAPTKQPPQPHTPQQQHHQVPSYQPGRIADYDPIASQEGNRQYISPYSVRQSAQTVIYTSERGAVTNPPTRKIGSIADLDPVNDYYGSIAQEFPPGYGGGRPGAQAQQHHHHQAQQQQQPQHYHHQASPQQPQHHHQQQQPSAHHLEQQRMHQMAQQQQRYQQQQLQLQQQLRLQQQQQQQLQQQQQQQQQQQHAQQQKSAGRVYRAMYDYDAQDGDEVSFLDGDILIGCTAIDEGWMTGTVQRTGAQGMLPANYVELVN